MNAQVKRLAAYWLRKFGYYRRLHALQRDVYKILCYHRFLPDCGSTGVSRKYIRARDLNRQMAFIQKWFHVLSLEVCIHHYKRTGGWPAAALSVTVDDGYEDIYHHAFPVFREKKIPATVFLVYDFIEHRTWLWQDKIKYILRNTKISDLVSDPVFDDLALDTYENMLACQLRIYDHVLMLPPDQRADRIALLAEKCGVLLPETPPPEFAPLSWTQIREMAGEGIRFGAHTLSHEVLTTLSETELQNEIEVSKELIEARLGREVETFCYPHGKAGKRELEVVKNAGFLSSVTGVGGNYKDTDLYSLSRLYVSNQPMSIFINSLYRF